MKYMMKYMMLVTMLLTFGCGVSPDEASDELDRLISHSEEWCGWGEHNHPPEKEPGQKPLYEVQEEVEKWFNPQGYGIGGDDQFCATGSTPWAGGYCVTPDTKTVRFRLIQGTQDNAWFKHSTDIYGIVETQLNGFGWSISRVGSSGNPTYEAKTGTTDPTGYLGTSQGSGWAWVATTPQGEFWIRNHCVATLFRTSIEANWAYQAASSTQKMKFLKNMWRHEYMHCFGLGHRTDSNKLMSVNYNFPGPIFDTLDLNIEANEQSRLQNFDPTWPYP